MPAPDAGDAGDLRQTQLSILYLRCPAAHGPRRAQVRNAAFNSLFEMHGVQPPQDIAQHPRVKLSILYLRCPGRRPTAPQRRVKPFQFSI